MLRGLPARLAPFFRARHLLLATAFGLAVVAVTAGAAHVLDRPASTFTREPQVVLEGLWYAGAISNLGGVLWFATAGILTFTYLVRPRRVLGIAAVLTWLMGLDDIFLLHDAFYVKLHIPEAVPIGVYFLGTVAIAVGFRGELAQSTVAGVMATVACWAFSAMVDYWFGPSRIALDQLTEDGAKFVGIAIWAAAWAGEARRSLLDLPAARARDAAPDAAAA